MRRCHGDLHLRNICLWRGRPTLFDCIEFNEDFACIDVLYDLAFLLMDLQHRSLHGFANLLLNEYLDRNDETGGVAALPLLMSLRAGIRAHTSVAAARAQSHPEYRQAIVDEARPVPRARRQAHARRRALPHRGRRPERDGKIDPGARARAVARHRARRPAGPHRRAAQAAFRRREERAARPRGLPPGGQRARLPAAARSGGCGAAQRLLRYRRRSLRAGRGTRRDRAPSPAIAAPRSRACGSRRRRRCCASGSQGAAATCRTRPSTCSRRNCISMPETSIGPGSPPAETRSERSTRRGRR